jgi:hypothetical protein
LERRRLTWSLAKRFIVLGAVLIGLAALLGVPGLAFAYATISVGTPAGQNVLILVESVIRMSTIALPAAGSAFLTIGLALHYLGPTRAHHTPPHQLSFPRD